MAETLETFINDREKDIFETYNIQDIKNLRRKLKQEINSKNEDLKNIVGKRYQNLLFTANTIQNLRHKSGKIVTSVNELAIKMHNFSDYSKLFLEQSSIENENWRFKKISQDNEYPLTYFLKLYLEIPIFCNNLLSELHDNITTLSKIDSCNLETTTILYIFECFIYNVIKNFIHKQTDDSILKIKNLFCLYNNAIDNIYHKLLSESRHILKNPDKDVRIIRETFLIQMILVQHQDYIKTFELFLIDRKSFICELCNDSSNITVSSNNKISQVFECIVMTILQSYSIISTKCHCISSFKNIPSNESFKSVNPFEENIKAWQKSAFEVLNMPCTGELYQKFEQHLLANPNIRKKSTEIDNDASLDKEETTCKDLIIHWTNNCLNTYPGMETMWGLLKMGATIPKPILYSSNLNLISRSLYACSYMTNSHEVIINNANEEGINFSLNPLHNAGSLNHDIWLKAVAYFDLRPPPMSGDEKADTRPKESYLDMWKHVGKPLIIREFYRLTQSFLEEEINAIKLAISDACAVDDNDVNKDKGNTDSPADLDRGVLCKMDTTSINSSFWNTLKFSHLLLKEPDEGQDRDDDDEPPEVGGDNSSKWFVSRILSDISNVFKTVVTNILTFFRPPPSAHSDYPYFDVETDLKTAVPRNLNQILETHLKKIIDAIFQIYTTNHDKIYQETESFVNLTTGRNLYIDPEYIRDLLTKGNSLRSRDDALAKTYHEHLIKQYLRDMYTHWTCTNVGNLGASIMDPVVLTDFFDCSVVKHIPAWDKIDISAQTGQLTHVFVPASCSFYVHALLYSANQSLLNHFGHSYSKTLLKIYISELRSRVISVNERFIGKALPDSKADNPHQTFPQNIALQCLFDLQVVSRFLNSAHHYSHDPYASSEDTSSSERIGKIEVALSSLIDPFDYQLLRSHVEANVRSCVNKLSRLFSIFEVKILPTLPREKFDENQRPHLILNTVTRC
ncbi:unnamed protein product [Gordionus sp. m RMFG-2023]